MHSIAEGGAAACGGASPDGRPALRRRRQIDRDILKISRDILKIAMAILRTDRRVSPGRLCDSSGASHERPAPHGIHIIIYYIYPPRDPCGRAPPFVRGGCVPLCPSPGRRAPERSRAASLPPRPARVRRRDPPVSPSRRGDDTKKTGQNGPKFEFYRTFLLKIHKGGGADRTAVLFFCVSLSRK